MRTWNDKCLVLAVAASRSWIEVIRKLNLASVNNYTTVRKHSKRLMLDTSHFLSVAELTQVNLRKGNKYTKEEVFTINSGIDQGTLRRYVKLFGVLEYRCAIPECANIGTYAGKPLALQLDHRNGINNDHRIENLRWLCPNCHSQTDTFGSRSPRKWKNGTKVKLQGGYLPGPRPHRRKFSYEDAYALYEQGQSATEIAARFGVKQSTVAVVLHMKFGVLRAKPAERKLDYDAISKLMAEGVGYKKIAKKLGYNQGSTKSACKRIRAPIV